MRKFPQCLCGFVAFCLAANLQAKDSTFPTVDCVITPSKVIEISAAVPGVVEALYVDRAQKVSKGQLLGELRSDVEKASARLAQARTEMKAELSAEQVNLKYDRIQSSRVNLLGEKKLASSQNLDEAARIKQVTYWRLKQAEEALQLRELELVRSQAQLEEKKSLLND
jgi:multidrug resistance efflux pump